MAKTHQNDAGSIPYRRIAVFGGSFDPPHVGHQIIALWALSTGQADEVWMVPCYKHPFSKNLSPYEARVAMCLLVTNFFPSKIRISFLEKDLGGVSWTSKTLKHLIKLHPDREFSLLIGADAYAERDKWRDFDDITRMASVISPGRGDLGFDAPVLSGVSSTQIREMVLEGRDISMLVPVEVKDYILERGLYKS